MLIVDLLDKLKPEDFDAAVGMVLARHPRLCDGVTDGQMDLDLSRLDALTLRQLSCFARACVETLNPETLNPKGQSGAEAYPGLVYGAGEQFNLGLRLMKNRVQTCMVMKF